MEESKKKINPLKDYWPQLTAIFFAGLFLGSNVNSLETVWTEISATEREHAHDVDVLNDEDDGVRADFVRADECNKEIAKLEDEVLYWKLKYELNKE